MLLTAVGTALALVVTCIVVRTTLRARETISAGTVPLTLERKRMLIDEEHNYDSSSI